MSADPTVAGDEDPTQILIQSAPLFDVDKISSYIDGDPAVLLAGETLRYTITVQNVGTDNATSVDIRDAGTGEYHLCGRQHDAERPVAVA